jgi:hypothetical protein
MGGKVMNKARALVLILLQLGGWAASASTWKNPKDLIGDPSLARLQQGRKSLTPEEVADLQNYGYTGLELMTYVHANQKPGTRDFDLFYRHASIDGTGILRVTILNRRWKYYYRDYLALLTHNGIKPGEVIHKRPGYIIEPNKDRGSTFLNIGYLRSKETYREETANIRPISLKRIRSSVGPDKQDKFHGTDTTVDDWVARQPWEENHRILGEDTFDGKPCFVVESKMWFLPRYYLSRRVTWVEKENFLDVHEEQFDPQGKLFKILEKTWTKHQPTGYWLRKRWNVVDHSSQSQSVEETFGWMIDQGLDETPFTLRAMENENPWRNLPDDMPPALTKATDLPPPPKVTQDFWKRIGQKVELLTR